MRTLQKFFIATNKILESQYERSSEVKHNGMKGRNREFFISNFLEKSFPKKFVIDTGEILDSDDKKSKQADIIIYDEFMPIFDYGATKHFLSGGVLAHIEVKSYLDSTKLKEALDITKSIKDLKRDLDVTISYGKRPLTIPSFIFAYDGMSKETFRKHFIEYYSRKNFDFSELDFEIKFEDMKEPEKELGIEGYVDGICVLNKYIMTKQVTGDSIKVVFWGTGKDSLMLFFMKLYAEMYKNWIGIPNLLKYLGTLKYSTF